MPTLQEQILKRKDPERYMLVRFDELEKEFRVMMDKAVFDAKKELASLAEDQIFKDLEPAKKLAKETAKEEIDSFKKETNEKVKSILNSVKETKEEILLKVDKQFSSAYALFMSEVKKLLSATVKEMGVRMNQREEKIASLETQFDEKVNSTIKEAKDTLKKLFSDASKFKGEKGDRGNDGKKGDDGSPDKPEEVVDKVNMAKNKVEMEAIKGLSTTLKSLERAIREKQRGGGSSGGGMGNVVQESFAVSSATTSITLANKVASNGRAMWLNWNGQQQSYGTHYTISGNVVTLLFTPADDTYIDVIYARA